MAIGIYPTFNPPVPEAQLRSDGKGTLKNNLNNLPLRSQALREDGVVPLTMKLIAFDTHTGEFFVCDFRASWILAFIQFGVNGQPRCRGGAADQIHYYGTACQGPPAPVLGDVAEHPVFDLVPLARPRGKVAHTDLQPGFVGQFL